MADWTMDSSGLRAAHRARVLELITTRDRVLVSTLTWLPVPTEFAVAVAPALRFPDNYDVPMQLMLVDSTSNPIETICEVLENLHSVGRIVLAEDHECEPAHVAEVEGMWKDAGLLHRPTDETIAAVLTAEYARLPLVCADVSARRLAQHCGLAVTTVDDFALAVAA